MFKKGIEGVTKVSSLEKLTEHYQIQVKEEESNQNLDYLLPVIKY